MASTSRPPGSTGGSRPSSALIDACVVAREIGGQVEHVSPAVFSSSVDAKGFSTTAAGAVLHQQRDPALGFLELLRAEL